MNKLHDDRILALYILIRQDWAEAVTDNQKFAIEQLKKYSLLGNPEADDVLHRLKNTPYIHPLLKEVLAA
jgi:hypothetical protein